MTTYLSNSRLAQIYRENTGPDEYKFVVEFNEMAKAEGL